MQICGGVQFNIEYSDNIKINSITSGNNDWTVMYTDGEELVTAYTGADGHKDTAFAKISYTVNANATEDATITLKNIAITNVVGEKTNVTGNVVKTVTISEGTQEPNPEPETKTLSSIAITTQPSKVNYTEGESFDKTGMVVTATYSDGTSSEVTNYTYTPNGKLQVADKKVTISYTEGNITKTVEQAIKVTKANAGTTEEGNIIQKDPTVANKVISQTGVTNTACVVLALILIVGIISYIKYKNYKEI